MGEACDGHSALTPYPTPLLFFPAPISLCCPHNLKTRKYSWEMVTSSVVPINYRKIPKISPGTYIFQRPFLRGLFLEGLIFGGAYVRREICVSKSIWLAFFLEGNLPFFCFILYLRAISKYKPPPPPAYIWRGDSTEGFLRYEFGGLIHGEAYFRNLTVLHN